ncbi:MAG: hypothetical protein CVU39_23990 [Chloroflexi bacterium HGW-Chloroflexi-10]|nr:MAG: hypothetical protein CVU39_23990 [Chloroflexi bacterium HGW-Chloroflexi-10]
MNKTILLMENKKTILDAYMHLLEDEGYQVYPAASLEDAKNLIEHKNIHLAIFDIRMVDEDDPNDISGLLLAKEPKYIHLPKIILTGYPSYEYVREVMGATENGIPAAVDFVSKGEGINKLLDAIEKAFAQQIQINEMLKFHWTNEGPVSFAHLASLLITEEQTSAFSDVCGEIEDLFRRMFFAYNQVNFARLIWNRQDEVCLEVYAYRDGVEEQYLITLGQKMLIDSQKTCFEKLAPKSFLSARWEKRFESMHYAIIQWAYPGINLQNAKLFTNFFIEQTEKTVRSSMETFFTTALPAWHQPKSNNTVMNSDCRSVWSPRENTKTLALEWKAILDKMTLLYKNRISLTALPDQGNLLFELPNGKRYLFPDPVHYYSEMDFPEWAKDDIVPGIGINHTNRLLVDGFQIIIADFSNLQFAPKYMDYIAMENSIRYELIDNTNLQSLLDFEENLAKLRDLSENVNASNVEPEFRKAWNVILSIRQAAAEQIDPDPLPYFQYLLTEGVRQLMNVDAEVHYSPRELQHWLHNLGTTSILCKRLAEKKEKIHQPARNITNSGIEIDFNKHEVRVNNVLKELTPTEFKLLAYLASRKGLLCTYDMIIKEIFGGEIADIQTEKSRLTTHILRLRKNIEPDPKNPIFIKTISGEGYRLDNNG